jgi:hypothetical protein
MLSCEQVEQITKLARTAARRYAARVGRAGLEADLTQQAWIAALDATRTYDPTRGHAEGAYIWRAIVLALGRHVRRLCAPVSAPDNAACAKLSDTRACPLEALADTPSEAGWAEGLLADHEWEGRVRARLRELAGADTAAILARRASRNAARRVWRRIRADEVMRDLAKDM